MSESPSPIANPLQSLSEKRFSRRYDGLRPLPGVSPILRPLQSQPRTPSSLPLPPVIPSAERLTLDQITVEDPTPARRSSSPTLARQRKKWAFCTWRVIVIFVVSLIVTVVAAVLLSQYFSNRLVSSTTSTWALTSLVNSAVATANANRTMDWLTVADSITIGNSLNASSVHTEQLHVNSSIESRTAIIDNSLVVNGPTVLSSATAAYLESHNASISNLLATNLTVPGSATMSRLSVSSLTTYAILALSYL